MAGIILGYIKAPKCARFPYFLIKPPICVAVLPEIWIYSKRRVVYTTSVIPALWLATMQPGSGCTCPQLMDSLSQCAAGETVTQVKERSVSNGFPTALLCSITVQGKRPINGHLITQHRARAVQWLTNNICVWNAPNLCFPVLLFTIGSRARVFPRGVCCYHRKRWFLFSDRMWSHAWNSRHHGGYKWGG